MAAGIALMGLQVLKPKPGRKKKNLVKDNFSAQSGGYALFRPTYPDELVDYIAALASSRELALDCGAGNGQLTVKLAARFRQVIGTDISHRQIENAVQMPNIRYQVTSAESTDFEAGSFDLITVAQAIHWFDFHAFYSEVRRTLKKDGVLAVIGYGLLEIEGVVGEMVRHFYARTLAGYWDQERSYIDEQYLSIPFPFREIKAPVFKNQYDWSLEQLIGYLNTWSAVQHYIRKKGVNPVEDLGKELEQNWGPESHQSVAFPILLRLGHV